MPLLSLIPQIAFTENPATLILQVTILPQQFQ